MADDKFLCGLNYKSLNFTDAHYEEALKMIKKPESANQLLLALLDISSRDDASTTAKTTTDTCCSNNSSVSQIAEVKTGFSTTNSLQDKEWASSGYSSITSFPSSSNQSLDSLHQHQALRKIFIDGSNVARTHGKVASFSWIGIQKCVQYFHSRQHYVKVIVPEERCKSADETVLAYLNDLDALIRTPSGCNDDFTVIDAASQENGIIVSNDQYREEKAKLEIELRRFIDHNRLPYVFVDDQFIPARDPRGRSGPSLNEFLRETPESSHHNSKLSRQRYQRNGISRRGQSQYNRVSNHPRLKSTCSLPSSFMNDQIS